MVNHRGEEFKALLLRVSEGMKPFFGTSADVIMLTCAGTGGLEAAIVNTLSPGDPVLAVTIGAFGDRFAKIAEVYGAAVTRLDVEWGEAATPAEVRDGPRPAIAGLKAVLLTHNETSTGRDQRHRGARGGGAGGGPGRADPGRRDLGAGRRAVRDGRVGPRPRRDRVAEGLDGRAGHGDGRRRAAGLGGGRDARGCRASTSTCKRHRDTAAAGETPWTPAVAVMYQVDEGLRLMQAEGDGVFARHAACQAMTRAGLAGASGSSCWRPTRSPSRTVTAARIPDGLDWSAFNKALKARGLVLAGGQGKLKGKIFRLGHLGSVTHGRDPGRDRRDRGGRHRAGPRGRAGRGRRGGAARAARRRRPRVAVPA